MHHPEYWRMTAWFGMIAALLVVMMLFGAALLNPNYDAENNPIPDGGLTLILISATLPDTLLLLFFMGLTLILIPPEYLLPRQWMLILNSAGYIFRLLGNLLITVNLEMPDAAGIPPMIDGAYQVGHLMYGLLIGVIAVRWCAMLPRWLRGAAGVAAMSELLLALVYTSTNANRFDQMLLNVMPVIWITMVAAALLLADQKQKARVAREDDPTTPAVQTLS